MNNKIPPNLGFDFRIPHRNWRNALAESFSLISMTSPGDVICITGPSRVGKSRLVDELIKLLNAGNNFEETGILPVVRVRAVNQGNNGAFASKAFAQRLLRASKHPIYCVNQLDSDAKGKRLLYDNTSEAAYMDAFSESIVYRKIRFLFIDEAQHVVYISKDAMAPVAVMDSWKSFAEENNLVLIIVGAYPVLTITSKSTHMVGRIQRVHFPRYFETQDDLVAFKEIVTAYQGIMHFDEKFGNLDDHLELLYLGSLGCIGLLRKWLKTASNYAAAVDQKVSLNQIRRAAPSATDHEVVLKEIKEGEHFLRGIFNSLESSRSSSKDQFISKDNAKKKSKSKPFQRNPLRVEANNRTAIKDSHE